MPKTLEAEPSRTTINPALLALKPRQVLISTPLMAKESKTLSLKSEQKALLLRSVAQYLDRCGFSKCFKKLLSEAQIEKKELNSALPDLEEVYGEFLNKSYLEAVEVKDVSGDGEEKKAGHETDEKKDEKKEVAEVSAIEGVEKAKKEKRKKKKKDKVKETDAKIGDGVKEKKKAGSVDDNAFDDHETDRKEKKKKEAAELSAMEGVEKVKKKKKKDPKVEVTKEEKVKEIDAEIEEGVKEKKKKKNKSKATEAETLGGEEKVSKKRKRSESEETKEQTVDDEESKRRKKGENVAEDNLNVQETPIKQTADVQQHGNVEKSETKSTNKKSGKGLSNPKETKKPFQRVNVEEVVFTDERLKDNSYWAKDGADSGYGAKAQEVLGQVRGRGFRHEKTKKKRGSYRGGEIDLQSHSVKFEYSDEE